MQNHLWLITVAIHICAATAVAQPVVYEDLSVERGLGEYIPAAGHVVGMCSADFDADGDVDVFVPTSCGNPNLVFRNDGAGVFTEVAATIGLAQMLNSRAGLWFDADGDRDLDLIVLHDRFGEEECDSVRPVSLFVQTAESVFEDVTDSALPEFPLITSLAPHASSLCAGDVNNDGFLDLCIGHRERGSSLLLNIGGGQFADITEESGIGAGHLLPWQSVMYDFNGDGCLDIFVAQDFNPNHLWLNQCDGTFVDIAPSAGIDAIPSDMGVAISDYNNDGLIDIYVTNVDRRPHMDIYNALYHNVSVGGGVTFEEVAVSLGCDEGGWGWGATFLDADCDGRLDIAATNGYFYGSNATDQSKFFWQQPDGTFSDASHDVQFDDTDIASGLIAFDCDRDGDLDLLQACHHGFMRLRVCAPVAARGGGNSNGWITIKPRQPGANHFAIGAVVRASIGETTMTRLIHAGCSMLGQEPAEAHFGLGDATIIDQVVIEWPDGDVTTVEDVAINQVLTINRPAESCPGDATGDSTVDLADLLAVIGNWGSDGSAGGDVTDDGAVDLADLLAVIGNWGITCP